MEPVSLDQYFGSLPDSVAASFAVLAYFVSM